jgi:intracellular septation protein
MRDLLEAGRLLLLDMASTIFFLVVLLLTKNLPLSVALGIALGFAQIGWQWTRKKPIDVMQWMSLVAVLGSGAATLMSHDPLFVMVKPSLVYIVVGLVMLRPGWMNRYLPPVARDKVAELAVVFGFAWAALMFVSAALNLFVALNFGVVAWSTFMTIYGIVSKAGMVLIQHATMRYIGGRRARASALVASHAQPRRLG